MKIYNTGLQHARKKKYRSARRILSQCAILHPTFERAWVSLAQMEKKAGDRDTGELVLRQGLRQNPKSSAILLALGLHLLQEEDSKRKLQALGLVRSAVKYDPESSRPVLKWKPVRVVARDWVATRQLKRRLRHQQKKEQAEASKPGPEMKDEY